MTFWLALIAFGLSCYSLCWLWRLTMNVAKDMLTAEARIRVLELSHSGQASHALALLGGKGSDMDRAIARDVSDMRARIAEDMKSLAGPDGRLAPTVALEFSEKLTSDDYFRWLEEQQTRAASVRHKP